MKNTKTLRTPNRFLLSLAILMLLALMNYVSASQKVYAAACVPATASNNASLAIQTI